MDDRQPTDFEAKVLRLIARHNRIPTGNKSVQYSAAARRLERLGYAGKASDWYLTDKGRSFLAR